MKRGVFCGILALCCLALTGCTVFGQHVRLGLITDFFYNDADSYEIGDAALSDEVRRLEIQWLDGGVEVVAGDNASIAERANRELSEDMRMRWRLEDGTLRIMYCNSGKWNINGLEKTLKVTLPQTTLERLSVTTVSGDVCMSGMRAESVECATTSGDVTASFDEASELNVRTISGKVDVTGSADAARVNADSTSGTVKLSMGKVDVLDAVTISGKLDISATSIHQMDAGTTSGNVTLRLAEKCDECTIRSISGGVMLALPEDSGFTLNFGTVSGALESGIAMCSRDGVQICGDGEQKFEIHTTSGRLTIQPET